MRNRFFFITLLLLCGAISAQGQKPKPVSYQKEIAPLLSSACITCHNDKRPDGGLSLASYTSLMKGGKGGKIVLAGKAAESRLLRYLEGKIQPAMPIGGSLKPTQIARIRLWIAQGATSDGDAKPQESPRENGSPLPHVAPPALTLAISPNGKTLAVGTFRTVQLWSMETHKRIGILRGHADYVRAVAFSSDGQWLAAGGGTPTEAGEVLLWNMATNRIEERLTEHTDSVYALAFSPNGTRLVTGSADRAVKIWDIALARSLYTLKDHADAVYAVCFSADGKQILSSGVDRSIKVWDAEKGKPLFSFTGRAHGDTVYSVELTPDRTRLLSAGGDREARLWNVGKDSDSTSLKRSLQGHSAPVHFATFSADQKWIATASADKTVRIWNAEEGNSITTLTGAKDWLYAVHFTPDSLQIVAGAWDGTILIWSRTEGKLIAQLSTKEP